MLKILTVNIWPIASKCPIGYFDEHLFNNSSHFQLMEIYTNDVEVYQTISESIYCETKRVIIKEKKKEKKVENLIPLTAKTNPMLTFLKTATKIMLPVRIESGLYQRIKDFAPDVVYTHGYDSRILKLALKLSKLTKSGLVIHTLDDWFTTSNSYNNVLNRAILRTALSKGVSIVASPAMTERIKELFGCDSVFISNCAHFEYSSTRCVTEEMDYDLLYVGNLTPDRYQSIREIASSLQNCEKTKKLSLHVYSPKDQIAEYGSIFPSNVVLHDSVAQDVVKSLIQKSKIVIHAESFSESVRSFIMYSLSTKIAEYTSMGKPIIYYGPDIVGVARFLRENHIGEVCTDPNLVVEKIVELLDKQNAYEEASRNALAGKDFFDTQIVQERLYQIMEHEKRRRM